MARIFRRGSREQAPIAFRCYYITNPEVCKAVSLFVTRPVGAYHAEGVSVCDAVATSFAEGNFISSVHDDVVRENFICTNGATSFICVRKRTMMLWLTPQMMWASPNDVVPADADTNEKIRKQLLSDFLACATNLDAEKMLQRKHIFFQRLKRC